MSQPADPTQLRDRLAEALRTTPSVLMDTPEERARHATTPLNHHGGDHYYWGCAMCRGEVDTLATALAAVVQAELDAKDTEIEQQAAAATVVREQQHREFLEIGTELSQERDRYRSAWLSARRRADCRTTTADLAAQQHTTQRVWDEYHLMKARAEAAEAERDEARAEIDRLTTELAAYDYYDGPPPRAIDSTPDISDYQEAQP